VSCDKYHPHVFVLPEDGANGQLATGFVLNLETTVERKIQILEEAGGWNGVLSRFKSDHVAGMDRYPNRFMVLLIDFDHKATRLATVQEIIPERLTDRVFILGAWSEPEGLKSAGLGSYEEIGSAMAQACREDTETFWEHPLLQNNASELSRLRKHVRPILFH